MGKWIRFEGMVQISTESVSYEPQVKGVKAVLFERLCITKSAGTK